MRLPMTSKCLEQAIALSWQLQRRHLAHDVIIAARPAGQRSGADTLHAWVEADGETIMGALPGPWIELWRTSSALKGG